MLLKTDTRVRWNVIETIDASHPDWMPWKPTIQCDWGPRPVWRLHFREIPNKKWKKYEFCCFSAALGYLIQEWRRVELGR